MANVQPVANFVWLSLWYIFGSFIPTAAIPMDVDIPAFSSSQEEARYWRCKAEEYKKTWVHLFQYKCN